MPAARDVTAFDERAAAYEHGWLGRLHREVVERTAEIALSAQPHPRKVLDVGCGTGYMLRTIAGRCPSATELAGLDPAASMIEVARASTTDPRVTLAMGFVEQLPWADGVFDLVLSTTSFDHWADQGAGLAECARVLTPAGTLVIADLFSPWLAPTLVGARREKARTPRRASKLIRSVGLHDVSWRDVYPLIKAVAARR